VVILYGQDGSGNRELLLYQTGTEGSNEDDWVLRDHLELDSSMLGKRLRFVAQRNFFTVYVNDAYAGTMHAGAILGQDTDGYSTAVEGAGYVGIYRTGTTASFVNTTVTQPELYTWTDAKILDQKMDAVAGLVRVIGDKRIKFQSTQDGQLKISAYTSRDDLGSIGDLIYQDSTQPTDFIPTHIRAVGEEISEYIDHSAAEKYGLLFSTANTPELDEEAAYAESARLVKDAIAQAGARRMFAGGQLDWEPEDEVEVSYTPYDGGGTVSEDVIVDAVSWRYKPGDLAMNATARENNG
jgi:hypothetical protein